LSSNSRVARGKRITKKELTVGNLQHLGSIRLTVYIAKKEYLEEPKLFHEQLPEKFNDVPEDLLGGRSLSSIIKFVPAALNITFC
jgi:hypothetical protein